MQAAGQSGAGRQRTRVRSAPPRRPMQWPWPRGLARPNATGVFLTLALLLGGAGINYPLIQLAIVVAAVVALWRAPGAPGVVWAQGGAARAVLVLFAAWAGLMAVQLVPLPPGLWRALPGRDNAAAVWDAAGLTGWHPASLTPDLTLAGLLALVPPFAAFVLVAAMPRRTRRGALRVLVVVALIGTVLGVLQIAGGADAPLYPFITANRGIGTGLFVDRNHQAALLLIALIAAQVPGVVGAWHTTEGKSRRHIRIVALAVSAVLAIGVVATLSRTGLGLLPLALLAGMAAAAVVSTGTGERRLTMAGLALLAGLCLVLVLSPTGQEAMQRFSGVGDEGRRLYWANTLDAIRAAWPLGTGFGSFVPVYMGLEPMSQLGPEYVNHAHQDFLEIVLEGGVVAVLIAAAAVATVAAAGWCAWRRGEAAVALAASGGLLVLAGFSLVEYPLRMTALGVAAAVLVALLVPAPEVAAPAGRPRRIGLLVLLALSALSQIGLSLVLAGAPSAASRVAPWLSVAWRNRAEAELAAGDTTGAVADAGLALRILPIDATAARVRALALIARGDMAGGARLMGADAALGWRDPPAQLWMAQAALLGGRADLALPHIDALLRQNVGEAALVQELRGLVPAPAGEAAIVDALTRHPGWRQEFLNGLAEDAAAEPDDVAHLLADMARAGVPAQPGETALIRWRLADAGLWGPVAQVWRASGGRNLLGDGDFAGLNGPLPAYAGPYVWRAPPLPGVSVTAGADTGAGGGRRLHVVSDGLGQGMALAQTVVLAPGRYRLGVALAPGAAGAAGAWGWACHGTGTVQPIDIAWRGDGRNGAGTLAVPAGCPAVEIGLLIDSDPAHRGWAPLAKITLDAE